MIFFYLLGNEIWFHQIFVRPNLFFIAFCPTVRLTTPTGACFNKSRCYWQPFPSWRRMLTIVSFEEHETALNPEHCNFGDEGNRYAVHADCCGGLWRFQTEQNETEKRGKGGVRSTVYRWYQHTSISDRRRLTLVICSAYGGKGPLTANNTST